MTPQVYIKDKKAYIKMTTRTLNMIINSAEEVRDKIKIAESWSRRYKTIRIKEVFMRTKGIIGIVAIVLMVFSVSLAFAQPMRPWKGWRSSEGWGMGTPYQRMYTPATVETISGTVESVDKITPMKGMYYGIHLLLKTDKEIVPVHLGPGWYIERLDTKIENGDRIEVKGSRVTMMGKPAVIAAEVKKGESVLKLRDENGIPVWAGWKR